MGLTGSTHWAETCEHEKSSIWGTFQKFLILCLILCLSTEFCHLSAFWVVRGSQIGRKWMFNPSKSMCKFSRGRISCNLIDLSTCCCDICLLRVQNRAIWVILGPPWPIWVVRGSQNGRKWTSNPSKSMYKFSRGRISCNLIDLSTCCCDICPQWVQNGAIWVMGGSIWEFSSLIFTVGSPRMMCFGHLTPLGPSTNWAESHSDADSSIKSDSYATLDDYECFGAHFGAKIRSTLLWCDFT